jgi:hypothetical protein
MTYSANRVRAGGEIRHGGHGSTFMLIKSTPWPSR